MRSINQLSEAELDDLIAKKTRQEESSKSNEDYSSEYSDVSGLSAFGQGALNSATLGFAPKIIAGVGAPILQYLRPDLYGDQSYSDVYKDFRDYSRGEMSEAAEAQPLAYGVGSIAGALPLPFPATTIKGAAGLGALYGGVQGFGGSDTGETFSINQGNITDALSGSALGGALGGVGQGFFNKVFPKKVPDTEVLDRISLAEKFGVPLTKGEALQNPQELLKEEAARFGRMGSTNQQDITNFRNQRAESFTRAAQKLRDSFGNGNPYTEKGAGVGESISNLTKRAIEERKRYGELYKEAKKNTSKIDTKDFETFVDNVSQDLYDQYITPSNAPKVFSELENLVSIKDPVFYNVPESFKPLSNLSTTKVLGNKEKVPVNKLEGWRQNLNRQYRSALKSGDEQAAYAFNEIKGKFDGFMDGVIEKAIDSNDTESLNALKKARTLSAEWFGKYTTRNPQEYGKKFVQDVIDNKRNSDTPYTNEQIVNKIFGGSSLGFKPESAAIAKELKKVLTPEEFKNIKLEAAQRLTSPLFNNDSFVPKATIYKNNLNNFIQNNPTVARELFEVSELKDLKDLGRLGDIAFNRTKSAANPSGTALLEDFLRRNKYTGWLINLVDRVKLDQDKIKAAAFTPEGRPIPTGIKASQLALTNKTNTDDTNEEMALETQYSKQSPASVAVPSNNLLDLSEVEIDRLIQNYEKSNSNNSNSLLNKISQAESGNNPNAKNPNSSASGLFQLTDDTWRSLSRRYGLTGNKNDPEVQRRAAELLLNENRNTLTNALDREPTEDELYIAHFLGAGEAAKLIKAKNSDIPAARLFPRAAKANRSIFFANGRPLSANRVYEKLSNLV